MGALATCFMAVAFISVTVAVPAQHSRPPVLAADGRTAAAARPYSDVQFVGFTIATREQDAALKGVRYAGAAAGNRHHFAADIRARVGIMKEALHRAAADPDLDHRWVRVSCLHWVVL